MDDDLKEEILYGRDPEHVRIFISSRMTLAEERKAAADAVGRVSGHKAWWWEEDAPPGVLHSERECIGFARTSTGLILLVGGELSSIVYDEYQAAREGGADRYILIRDTDDLPEDVKTFIDQQRSEVVTRNFKNLPELETHIHKALEKALVRALNQGVISRRSRLGGSDD